MENSLTKQNDFQSNSMFSHWRIKPEIKIGDFNFNPPICNLLKNYYGSDITKYICHQQAMNELSEIIYVFIMLDDLLITKNFNLKDDPDTQSSNPIISIIDYKKIYSINMDFVDNANKLKIQLLKNDSFTSFDALLLTFDEQKYVYLFYHFIIKQMTRTWQKFFESKMPIPEPHIYQCHFFLKKINRRGKQQNRVIVMSDKFIFNTEYTITFSADHMPIFTLLETKWAVAIESFMDMKILPKTPNMLKIGISTNKNKLSIKETNFKFKNTSSIELMFYCENDFKAFIFQCRRVFNLITKKYIDVSIKK